MHRRTLRLVLGALVAVTSLIVAGAAGGVAKKPSAGAMVFGAEQEPPCLNGFLEGCNNTWTSWTAGIALASPYIIYPDFSARPYMATAKLLKRSPFTLRVTLKKNAKWSDGKPVTADDLIFTWKTITNPNWELAGRSGYELITGAKKAGAKTAIFTFSKPYAAWKAGLLGSYSILPKHALEGENFNEVWNAGYKNKQGQEIASGPFKLQSYTKGQSIVMVRNPTFFGKKPSLDKITFVFRTVTDTEIQAIRGGEVDAIYPQPQLQLAALRGQSGLRVQTNAGTTLEHIDINTGPGNSNPLLGQRWFRQALAYSLDRRAMVRQLFRTLNPGLPVLQNLMYATSQKGKYQAHFQRYTHSVAKVTALMRAHKCTKGGDGIWSCGGTRASVRLGTTAGNRLRELAVEIMQAQAKAAGIEFKPDNQPSRLFFPRISDNKYDLALFAWVGTGDPVGNRDIYGCPVKNAQGDVVKGGSNWKNYCNKTVTRLLEASDSALNPKTRINLVNRADKVMATDVPTIPLYQKPTYFVFKTKLGGLRDNPTLQGPTWNTERWTTR